MLLPRCQLPEESSVLPVSQAAVSLLLYQLQTTPKTAQGFPFGKQTRSVNPLRSSTQGF